MPAYAWKGKNRLGELQEGVIVSETRDGAAAALRRNGIQVLAVRAQLSLVLEGVICQALIPKASGKGRVLGLEVMVPSPAIRNLIREDKIHQIYSSMQTGQLKFGMQTFNQSLSELVLKGEITQDAAMSYSSNQEELRELINRGVGTTNMTQAPNPPKGGTSAVLGGRNPNIKYT